jgi:hypothetical protein
MDVISALIGVLFGWALTMVSEWRRDLRAIRREKAARDDAAQAQLWDLSRPPAERLQREFAALMQRTRKSSRGPEPYPGFAELFDDQWEDEEPRLLRDVALIPDSGFRAGLQLVCDGISANWGLAAKAGYRASGKDVANDVATLGFEITSAWLRAEREFDQLTVKRLEELRNSLDQMWEQFQNEDDARRQHRSEN